MEDNTTRLFIARVQDAIRLCTLRNQPKFIGFLDETSAAVALPIAQKSGVEYLFFGGHGDAERTILGFFPPGIAPSVDGFPIRAVRFSYRAVDRPQHRAVLGALMHCGIERDTVGDILIDDTYAVAFVHSNVSRHILEQVKSIGSTGVTADIYTGDILPSAGECAECSDTISSERLDCVVAALAKCSRTEACTQIEQGRVFVNGLPQDKITKRVFEGEKITIRGKGKFIIQSLTQRTKKGRIILNYKKYI